jgi:arachidonate 15-lipoxygenase
VDGVHHHHDAAGGVMTRAPTCRLMVTPRFRDLQKESMMSDYTPSLPQDDGLVEQYEREAQLRLWRLLYQYKDVEGLPMPMADEAAAAAQLLTLEEWVKGQAENQAKILFDLKIWEFLTHFEKALNSLEEYAKVFTTFSVPEIAGTWRDDKIFSSQRLAGLNPMVLQRVTIDGDVGLRWSDLRQKLSPQIDDTVVQHFLGRDSTLTKAVQDNCLFVCDFEALTKAKAAPNAPGAQRGQYLLGPIALFVKTSQFRGVQIAAIQLNQSDETTDFPVMCAYQADQPGNAAKWLMAKMFLQAADLNYNQIVNHLAQTHLVEEAFALSTHRNLALQHPLHILLNYHFAALLVINQAGILTLLNPTGAVQQILEGGLAGSLELIQQNYAEWTFDDFDFPSNYQRRGLTREFLPYFPYRDDGTLLWDLLGQYVHDYLALYYRPNTEGDKNVQLDYELQCWARELSREGKGEDSGLGKVAGFPPEISSFIELCTIVHRLIWTAGPQHAAVNFPQLEYATFIPNLPGATYIDPPKNFQDTTIDSTDLLRLLPPKEQTSTQVSTSYALAGYHYDQLLDYYGDLPLEAGQVAKKYYDELVTTVR